MTSKKIKANPFFHCFFLLCIFSVPLLLSCASASFVVSKPAAVPEDFFGITPSRSPLDREDFDLLDYFNAVWIRDTPRWSFIEQEEGKWDFEYWDYYVEKAEAAGKKMVFVLGFDNPWLYSNKKEHRDLTEREIPYFLKYVEQIVSRYRNRVVYEIWNEPNWLFWKGSSEHFFALSAAAAKKIREIEPTAVIIAGSTMRVSRRFTQGMHKAGALENVDGFSLHPYAASPGNTINQIDKQRKILDKLNFGKPIWITEVGYSTGPISFCSIKRYPEYIIKTLCGMAVRAGSVQNFIWFEYLNDYNKGEEPNRLNPVYHFGLIYPNREFKPGAKAFSLTAQNLAGSEYRPELPLREGIKSGITSLYFKGTNGRNTLILWKDGDEKQKLLLAVSGTAEVFYHDILTGEALALNAETVLRIGRDPVFVTWTGEGIPALRKVPKP